MLKMNRLRETLTASSRWCRANPEKLTVFAETGSIETTGETPTFSYRYTLVAFVMDFPGHIDELMLPLIVWLMHNQPDLLLNPEKNKDVKFSVAVNDDDSTDLLLEIPVRERVKVCRNERGELYPVHLPEPRLPAALTGAWGELIIDDATFKELTDEHDDA
ncbi:phage tail protein [Escherichia coli]|uniref:phage tail protein n=1 Tax=Escherichia coli TaxID=562 RepID=UPI000BE29A63|nr:phage tail protein [Escherichia coli]